MPRLFAVLVTALTLALPATASAADVVERAYIDSVDGSKIFVELVRPDNLGKVPVILTYSPYNTLNESTSLAPGETIAKDSYYTKYGPKGYARAYADVVGTRNSSGCWDYGGAKEIQSGVDVVNWLSKQPWSNGKVGMIGVSYEGTTANMVAAQGDKVPGLAAIVPQAAISRWYGYAYQDGVRYFGNSQEPTDEGFDTPLAFDFGFGRTVPTNPSPEAATALRARLNECNAREHTEKGYDRTPDYDAFWNERDYLKDAAKVKAASLVTHGLQDFNVKQSEGIDFYDALPGRGSAFKKLFVYQGTHGAPGHTEYAALLERFFAKTLKGASNGVESEPPSWSEGRNGTAKVKLKNEGSWPPPGTRALTLDLGRSSAGAGTLGVGNAGEDSYTDRSNTSEEVVMERPEGEQTWRYYVSEPLKEDVRIAGSPVFDALLKTSAARGQMSPTLFDVPPSGSPVPITRGHLNLLYRDGLSKQVAPPVGTPFRARTRLAPQDQTIAKGHRIALIVASSNVAWALPDDPNVTYTVQRGGQSRLVLPVVGAVAAGAVPGGKTGGTISSSSGSSSLTAAGPIAAPRAGGGGSTAAGGSSARSKISLHIWRLRGNRLRLYGRAVRGARLTFKIAVRGRRTVTRRVKVGTRSGAFRVTLRGVARRRAVSVRMTQAGSKLKITRRLSSRQVGNRPK